METLFGSTTRQFWNSNNESKPKHVLITGSSAGIGAEMARCFARRGACLALLSLPQNLEDVKNECLALGSPRVETYEVDLTDPHQIADVTNTAAKDFDNRFDVVVLNAGRSMGCYFHNIQKWEHVDSLIRLNVNGTLLTLQQLMPSIPKQKESRIVVVGSLAGFVGLPFRSVYSASKFALQGFCNAIRLELRDEFGSDAPSVCFLAFPQVSGTDINQGRLTMGADKAPANFKDVGEITIDQACIGAIKTIAAGYRTSSIPFLVACLMLAYRLLPGYIPDWFVIRQVKKTHYRTPEPQNSNTSETVVSPSKA